VRARVLCAVRVRPAHAAVVLRSGATRKRDAMPPQRRVRAAALQQRVGARTHAARPHARCRCADAARCPVMQARGAHKPSMPFSPADFVDCLADAAARHKRAAVRAALISCLFDAPLMPTHSTTIHHTMSALNDGAAYGAARRYGKRGSVS